MARKKDLAKRKKVCMVPGCTAPQSCCGMCHNHYNQATAKDEDGKPLRPFQYYIDKGWAVAPHIRGLLRRAEAEADAIDSVRSRRQKAGL